MDRELYHKITEAVAEAATWEGKVAIENEKMKETWFATEASRSDIGTLLIEHNCYHAKDKNYHVNDKFDAQKLKEMLAEKTPSFIDLKVTDTELDTQYRNGVTSVYVNDAHDAVLVVQA